MNTAKARGWLLRTRRERQHACVRQGDKAHGARVRLAHSQRHSRSPVQKRRASQLVRPRRTRTRPFVKRCNDKSFATMTCCMSPCPIWKCDLKTTPCYKDNAIDQKCADYPPIPDHNQRMPQGEKRFHARDDAFNDGAPSTWMGTGNAQVARKGALRAWGARVLLAQLRILATSLAAIKVEEKMRLAQNSLGAHRWIPG